MMSHLTQVYPGIAFDVLAPKPEDIRLSTIAHALSNICRYGGQSRVFYSVAQHSVLVSLQVPRQRQLHALLHDASEAYLGDIPSPLKYSGIFDRYLEVEALVQTRIYKAFGLAPIMPPEVKEADEVLLSTEARDLMSPLITEIWPPLREPLPGAIFPWYPDLARSNFIRRYNEIVGLPE